MAVATPGREAESPWFALHRRKVVQWGAAYAAGSWVLLQVFAFAADTFGWPTLAKQFAVLGLIAGFPIALTLAWYHGERGQQRLSGSELALLTLLLFVGGSLLWLYGQRDVATTSTAGAPAGPPPREGVVDVRPSIAVLPFENRSRIEDDALFVDGIHDDILTQLSKLSALKVISRTSVERFRDTKESTRAIAEQLGVKSVLEGGVQRAGDRVRINVQLIDAVSDAHLWAETYDRELTAADIFAIQSEVAIDIAAALKATLTDAERAQANAVPTQSLEAWEAYQFGRKYMVSRSRDSLLAAEQSFRKAIGSDAAFPLAWAGLADTLYLQTVYGGVSEATGLPMAQSAVEKALELNPGLGEAWATAASIADLRGQIDRADKMYRRAVVLAPNYALGHHWYGFFLARAGRPDEAVAQAKQAVGIEPTSVNASSSLGTVLQANGDFDAAEVAYRRARSIDPRASLPYQNHGYLSAYARNDFGTALAYGRKARELDPSSELPVLMMADLYLDLGDLDQFSAAIAEAEKRWPDSGRVQSHVAQARALLGDEAGAVRHAERALIARPRIGALTFIRNAGLRAGRYEAVLARYRHAYPELFERPTPFVYLTNAEHAVDLALVLQKAGEKQRAAKLLDAAMYAIEGRPRLGTWGYGLMDVQIHALRGDRAKALAALRQATAAGWRGTSRISWDWRYYRDIDPNLASIRDDPEFKAVFAEIERDMARQRAGIARQPVAAKAAATL